MKDIIACSGGKDSTALALLLHDRGVPCDLFWTSTGNEPPGVEEHITRLAAATGARLITPPAPTLFDVIEQERMLPNFRARFCTRQIKIEPCIAWFREHGAGITLHVGLRADEPEREGIYDEMVERRFLLREVGWDVEDVIGFVKARGWEPPHRTDCMLCPMQRLGDWAWLLATHPEEYQRGIDLEDQLGHTFRSPRRDTWPAGLRDLAAEFAKGRAVPTRVIEHRPCRVCTL